jgi:hypothetical protein
MDKAYMLIVAILALIFIGFISSRRYQPTTTTTTTKAVVVRDTPPHYNRRYGSNPHYNPYKAQYY